ncbi:hypothetical protein FOXG_15501 [Fusarium oxysporum f. sp. lycopersici 4287]|uniref:Uncharacterized protein n=1 Tax=Fusarium oxysporum f. sp. lycopersici (strain 4287 / CBS 123668 / FGSC 9935 / NRRL 34936) TaxID=426428 RepID=A0A0J9W3X4_FUSO4|nr:hypothetical protein FOXG_15501 [Fusarium oxysporum f. sp. lycopersici 4287]KNB17729.1 hypothetical protein FOXG_15501 [Fusarium oxysporum f. sp. lycopersici 4287]
MDSRTRRERLSKEKQQHFLGIASIRFGALDFDWCRQRNPLSGSLDQKNVASLETMFRRGCDWSPEQVSHQIPALIDPALLEESLQRAEKSLSLEDLKKEDGVFAELDLADGRVICLKGEHRVLASDATVVNRKKRWIVRLYSTETDLSEDARNDLADERASERQMIDAEYFYNITLFWLKNGDPDQGPRPNPWFAQLMRHSEGKAKDLKRLWSGPSSQGDLLRRFHEIPALFWGISLGNVGKTIAMPRQQTRNQIKRVFDFWDYICCHDVSMKLRLDMNTVKVVSGRASGAYAGLNLANSGEILRNFDTTERAAILSRLELATTDRVVPTLGILFRNTLYLQSARDLWDDLNNGFEERGDGRCLLQVSDTRFKLVHVSEIDQFEIARRQLWLFDLREFPSLPRDVTSKRAEPKSCVDEAKLFELAVLAHRLGCRSDQIDHIRTNTCWRPSPMQSVYKQDSNIDSKPYKHGKPHPEDLKRYKNKPQGIDELLHRAAEVGECELIDDEYRPRIQGASEQLICQEDQLRASISELQERYDQLLSQESQCQRRIDNKKQEENKLDESIRAKKAQGQNLENQKTQLQTELNQGEAAKRDLDTEYQTLCQEVADQRQSLSALNSKKEAANDDLKRLEHQKNNVEQVINTLESRKKELESEAQEVRNQEEEAALFPIEEDTPPPTSETSDLQRMAFPVEMRRKTRVVKTEIELTAWLEVLEQRGYSMVDQHMKTLVPHSCFKALKDEEQEKDRLIILLKEFHSEYDFLEEGCLQWAKKRARVEYIFRDADEIREKKRTRVNQTDDVDDIL